MEKLVLNSPAKINIGLNITKKRADGYHDLKHFFIQYMIFAIY